LNWKANLTAKNMYDLQGQSEPKGIKRTLSFFGAVGGVLYFLIEVLVVALALAVVVYLFLLSPHEVIGHSMDPNFANGEYLIANKVIYKTKLPNRGDVIIFKHSETEDYIKRVIGLPGDTVAIQDGKLVLNGNVLDESEYLKSSVYTNGDDYLKEGQSITVPDGKIFVCGDNRPNSSDSRNFGPISLDLLKGKAWLVYYPFSDLRLVEHAKYQ